MIATHARMSSLNALNHRGMCFILIWIQDDTDDDYVCSPAAMRLLSQGGAQTERKITVLFERERQKAANRRNDVLLV